MGASAGCFSRLAKLAMVPAIVTAECSAIDRTSPPWGPFGSRANLPSGPGPLPSEGLALERAEFVAAGCPSRIVDTLMWVGRPSTYIHLTGCGASLKFEDFSVTWGFLAAVPEILAVLEFLQKVPDMGLNLAILTGLVSAILSVSGSRWAMHMLMVRSFSLNGLFFGFWTFWLPINFCLRLIHLYSSSRSGLPFWWPSPHLVESLNLQH